LDIQWKTPSLSLSLSLFNHTKVQLLKIDIGSVVELFTWFLKLGGRGLVG